MKNYYSPLKMVKYANELLQKLDNLSGVEKEKEFFQRLEMTGISVNKGLNYLEIFEDKVDDKFYIIDSGLGFMVWTTTKEMLNIFEAINKKDGERLYGVGSGYPKKDWSSLTDSEKVRILFYNYKDWLTYSADLSGDDTKLVEFEKATLKAHPERVVDLKKGAIIRAYENHIKFSVEED